MHIVRVITGLAATSEGIVRCIGPTRTGEDCVDHGCWKL